MGKYAALVDTSRCTACRGCQIACKQWNENPAEKTRQVGTYQNPPDLSNLTYTIIRFKEQAAGGKVAWNFFKDQCRHCLEPPCKDVADSMVRGAILQDTSGAVIYTEKTKDCDFGEIREACPYDIPRQDPATGVLYKCTFCNDRIDNGMVPVCIKACPTGALQFGLRKEILKRAETRLRELKKSHPAARILDRDEVSWIYILHQPEAEFQMSRKERSPSVRYALRSLFKPLGILAMGAAVVGQVSRDRE
ncbi:MAG: formate dehydrogenase [Deltaproteobacteria bacterium]|nr:formate dehydrogenase [Deltaproteobacteria bacterium]MBW2121219.1 formate dehydrogenase [Deltaproteobacteria bacterium]